MLKESLQAEKNNKIQEFIQDLSPTADTNYSLWKIAKKNQQTNPSGIPFTGQQRNLDQRG